VLTVDGFSEESGFEHADSINTQASNSKAYFINLCIIDTEQLFSALQKQDNEEGQ
jgi:hypothetical protein